VVWPNRDDKISTAGLFGMGLSEALTELSRGWVAGGAEVVAV
jgi:hypothetical protein